MAALGCSTATAQMGQLCAANCNIRAMAVNDRSQSCAVSEMGARAAVLTRESRHRPYHYNSAWGRGNNTIISGHMPSFGSQSGGWWGNFLQIFRPISANAFNNFRTDYDEDVRVDNAAREPAELLEPEVEPADQTLNVVEVKKAGQNAAVAEKALDKSSTVATSALDKVGDVLRSTGLEINLDVGLKELTIKELVLRDLGLVLEVKTKPQPQAQAQAEAPQAESNEGGSNTA